MVGESNRMINGQCVFAHRLVQGYISYELTCGLFTFLFCWFVKQ